MKVSELVIGLFSSMGYKEYSVKELIKISSLFDFTESHLRTSLCRMLSKNILQSRREGKKAYYSLSQKGVNITSNISNSFRDLNWHKWDNKWWGITFSVPENKKTERHIIRQELVLYKFASLHSGFWIRPHHYDDKIENKLCNVMDSKYCKTIIFKFFYDFTYDDTNILWNIEEKNKYFKEWLDVFKEYREGINTFSFEKAFKEKMLVGGKFVEVLFQDPQLPTVLLPEDWCVDKLRKEFSLWNHEISILAKQYIKSLKRGV